MWIRRYFKRDKENTELFKIVKQLPCQKQSKTFISKRYLNNEDF